MIPKVIHYCWFGHGAKSDLMIKCIESWKNFCPEFEIVEWNESNFDVCCHPYVKEAYEQKKYAFVSDFARLYIIYKHGGIYLDTDVEIKNSIIPLLKESAVLFWENERYINTGVGFGAKANHPLIERMLEEYNKKESFSIKERCPQFNTQGVMSYEQGLQRNGTTQQFKNFTVYSVSDYKEYARHLYAGSWGDDPKQEFQTSVENKSKSKLILNLRQEKYFNWIRKHFGENTEKIYEFIVYDLFDTGIMFFVKRLINKIIHFRKKE